jgi:hypothetical protein
MSDVIDDDVRIDSNTKALNADALEMTLEERPTVPRPDESSLAQSDPARSLGYPLTNEGTVSATAAQGSAISHTTLSLFACHRTSHPVSNTNTGPLSRGMYDPEQHRLAYTETHPAVGATERCEAPDCAHTTVSDGQRGARAETTQIASPPVGSQQAETACEYR